MAFGPPAELLADFFPCSAKMRSRNGSAGSFLSPMGSNLERAYWVCKKNKCPARTTKRNGHLCCQAYLNRRADWSRYDLPGLFFAPS